MYDFLVESDLQQSESKQTINGSWIILIVDDEPAIHTVTKFALEDECFDGKSIDFISAFSAQEAKEILKSRDDIALVLLDVVMEVETAGLEMAAWIREELDNKLIRIILRTGQPGQAPEKDVIVNYDIFDYKNKTELTAQKLFSCVISGLRSYRDVLALSNHSLGLKKVVQATASLFKQQYAGEYASGVLLQLTSLLYFSADAVLITLEGASSQDGDAKESSATVIAGVGQYQSLVGSDAFELLPREMLEDCVASPKQIQNDNRVLFCYDSRDNYKTLLYLKYEKSLSKDDYSLIELFVQSIASAQEKIRFWQDTEDTLNELISILSKSIEEHSVQGDQYFTGVTKIAMLVAKKHGLILKKEISNRRVKL